MKHLEIHNNVTDAQKKIKAGDTVLVTRDNGSVEKRLVSSGADELDSGDWVVWLHGIRGCYALCRVQPIPERISS